MLTEKDYCDLDTCVALRELGYNYPQRLVPDYFGVFNEPQYDERIYLYDAQKWLREEKNIIIDVRYEAPYYNVVLYHRIAYRHYVVKDKNNRIADFTEYEEALSEGVRASIKILKEE